MKTRLIAALVVLALIVTAGIVAAAKQQRGPAERPAACPMTPGGGTGQCAMRMGAGFGPQMAQELNLTDAQIQDLQKLWTWFNTSTADLREKMKAETQTLTEMMTAESVNPEAIKAQAAKVDDIRSEIHKAAIDRIATGLTILNADQRAKLADMIKSRPGMGMCLGMGCAMGPGCCMGGPKGGPNPQPGNCPLNGSGTGCCPRAK